MLLILQIYTYGPVHDCTIIIIGLRKIPFYINFHVCIDTAINTPMCIIIILTPNEYYTELPALAINAASNKPGLAASASHTASFI